MKAIDWIFIGYFLIGFICGVISIRAYTKEYGDSPASVILFLCNLAAWWIAFPSQMIELKQEKKEEGGMIMARMSLGFCVEIDVPDDKVHLLEGRSVDWPTLFAVKHGILTAERLIEQIENDIKNEKANKENN